MALTIIWVVFSSAIYATKTEVVNGVFLLVFAEIVTLGVRYSGVRWSNKTIDGRM